MGRKQLYGRFKRLIHNISHDQTRTWLRRGNFKRETESLLIAAQDNAVRTNHIKARIDKTQLMVILIIISAFGTVTKGFANGEEGLEIRYLSLPPTRQDLTQGQNPEG